MALEQEIAAQTQAVGELTQEVVNKMGVIDARIAAKETEVDNYIDAAASQAPFLRITRNQSLMSQPFVDGVPEGFSSDGGATYTPLFTVNPGSVGSATNVAELNAFLADIGMTFNWASHPARALKVVSAGAVRVMKIVQPIRGIDVSYVSYIRVNSGNVSIFGVPQPADAQWHLHIQHRPKSAVYFERDFIKGDGSAFDVDVFLPARVLGRYAVTPAERYWLIPIPAIAGGLSYLE